MHTYFRFAPSPFSKLHINEATTPIAWLKREDQSVSEVMVKSKGAFDKKRVGRIHKPNNKTIDPPVRSSFSDVDCGGTEKLHINMKIII